MLSLRDIANALAGEISGDSVLAPGPGHSKSDRSLSVKPEAGAPGGLLVHSFAGDDPIICKDFALEKCGLPAFTPNGGNGKRRRSSEQVDKLFRLAVRSQPEKPKWRPVET